MFATVHIAFDARWYSHGNPSGRTVVRNLLPELLSLRPSSDDFTLLVRRGDDLAGLEAIDDPSGRIRVKQLPSITALGTNAVVTPLALRKSDVDVVVSQFFSPLWGKFRTVTFVYDVIFLRRPDLFSRIERLYLSSFLPLARRASRLCTISEHERAQLVELGLGSSEEITVVPLAPRPEFFSATEESSATARAVYGLPARYVLCVGRLNVRKNLGALLGAVASTTSVTEECPLVLAGAPVGKGKSEELSTLLGQLGARARPLGFVDDALLPGLVAGAAVLVFVSLDEGFGLPPLEAMACGTPVLVSDRGVFREVCGEAACYVDPLSPSSIATALDELLADETDNAEQRERCRQRARLFTWARSAAALSQAIDLACGNGGGRSHSDRTGG